MEKDKNKSNRKDKVSNETSFSFKWNSEPKKKIQGTAFKKKAVKSDGHDRIPLVGIKHIKRKHRKDKLLAKLGGDAEINPTDKRKKTSSLFSGKNRVDVYVDTRSGKSVSEVVFTEGIKFGDLNVHKHLVSNLEKINLSVLTNVQEKSIPILLQGKNALIRSQTGSGKTLAYAVPIIDSLLSIEPRIKRTDGVQVLIVVPTRELALQTHDEFNKINTFQWIVTGRLCGGESRKTEKDRIRKGINVLIGTPGRLLDHALHTSALDLSRVRCLVLDEADRLLDMGFRKDIISLVEKIDSSKSAYNPLEMIVNQHKRTAPEGKTDNLPVLKDVNSKERQTILLSATLTKNITELAELTTKDHVYIDALDETRPVDDEDFVIPSTVTQEFLITPAKHRLFTLSAIIAAKSKQNSKAFVFMASTHMVEFHHELFSRHLAWLPRNRGKRRVEMFKGERVVVFDEDSLEEGEEEEAALDVEFFKLHGNMDQRERKEVFLGFKAAKKGVLICTDVAARGLDVAEADCIIQYTPPQSDKDYLHRIGRTGRAGKSGSALIFLTPEEQEFVSHLRERKVFLKRRDPGEFLSHLCALMDERGVEEAATALQRHLESRVAGDKSLKESACFAYSTWSRFYNSYPAALRKIFDFKRANLGHFATSFGLTVTPTEASSAIRGRVAAEGEGTKKNKRLANHEEDDVRSGPAAPKKRKGLGLSTSEYSSGLEPPKKRKKRKKSHLGQ